jgi:benzoylformate decarboxylase
VRLAERHNARVFVAPMSGRCSFPEDHRLFAGFLPAIREQIVAALARHDLIFAIGAPAFTYHVEGFGPHIPPGAQLVQLTEDPQTASWTPEGIAAIGSMKLGLIDLLSRPAPVLRDPPRPNDSIVVEEAPSARPVLQARLPITRSEAFYTMDSGGLGYGLPAAVGVALGKPGQRVIAIIGDGSSLYSIQALWSAAQLGLPIAIIILNNRRYAALQDFAPVFGFGSQELVQGTDLPDLDFVTIAKGMNCAARRAGDAETLQAALHEAFACSGPLLIDAVVEDRAKERS